MASIFAHALVASTIKSFWIKNNSTKILLAGIFCSVIPDADVIMFKFGYAYSHWLGHRGFFHSIFFCICLSILISYLLFPRENRKWTLILFLSICGISHGVLDAMTDGGRGIAFFSPFSNQRYFFPFRPIEVSPLGISRFFSDRGIRVLKSEGVYIALPCIIVFLINFIRSKISKGI